MLLDEQLYLYLKLMGCSKRCWGSLTMETKEEYRLLEM